jgi:hypothetical protein
VERIPPSKLFGHVFCDVTPWRLVNSQNDQTTQLLASLTLKTNLILSFGSSYLRSCQQRVTFSMCWNFNNTAARTSKLGLLVRYTHICYCVYGSPPLSPILSEINATILTPVIINSKKYRAEALYLAGVTAGHGLQVNAMNHAYPQHYLGPRCNSRSYARHLFDNAPRMSEAERK